MCLHQLIMVPDCNYWIIITLNKQPQVSCLKLLQCVIEKECRHVVARGDETSYHLMEQRGSEK